MSPQPGDVWLADLGWAGKVRPVVIVSRHDDDAARALVIYVPLTTQNRGSDYEVPLPKVRFLKQESVANVQGIGSLPTNRLGRRLGVLATSTMSEIRRAIIWALDLDRVGEESVRSQGPATEAGQQENVDLELVATWLYGAASTTGRQDLVRDVIRNAFQEAADGYGLPDDNEETDEDDADPLRVRRALARFLEAWNERAMMDLEDDVGESGTQSPP